MAIPLAAAYPLGTLSPIVETGRRRDVDEICSSLSHRRRVLFLAPLSCLRGAILPCLTVDEKRLSATAASLSFGRLPGLPQPPPFSDFSRPRLLVDGNWHGGLTSRIFFVSP